VKKETDGEPLFASGTVFACLLLTFLLLQLSVSYSSSSKTQSSILCPVESVSISDQECSIHHLNFNIKTLLWNFLFLTQSISVCTASAIGSFPGKEIRRKSQCSNKVQSHCCNFEVAMNTRKNSIWSQQKQKFQVQIIDCSLVLLPNKLLKEYLHILHPLVTASKISQIDHFINAVVHVPPSTSHCGSNLHSNKNKLLDKKISGS
jgi:hypothetical protein